MVVLGCADKDKNDTVERGRIKEEWLKSTKQVVEKINDREAIEIFQFLEKNLILAVPNEKGMKFLERAQSEDWLAIMPLLEKDKEANEHWRYIFSSPAAAHFLNKIKAVVLKDSLYNPTGKAIVFLHEGYHAYTFIKNPYEKQSDKEYCYEEVKAHTFQNRVMALIGGAKYQFVLDKEVKRINDEAKRSVGNFTIPNRTEYDEDLITVFGKPDSKMEKDFIQTSVWINAVFVHLDKVFKNGAEDRKALFLRHLYKKDGVL